LFKIIKYQLECYINSKFVDENKIRVSVIGKRALLPKDLITVIERLEEKTKNYSNLRLYIALGYGGRQEICDAFIKFISDNISDVIECGCADDISDADGSTTFQSKSEQFLEGIESNKDAGKFSYLSDIVTIENISKYLYVKDSPDPDLIIRTSGEVRLSGFLLWQSVYSEFYFCDAYWPEFREIDFLRAIRSYQSRHVRAGE